ncbi:MAG: TetR/AcrR family transcriptional regulator [Actinomycetota bacterium]
MSSGTRAERARLTPEAIVDAAMEVLDREGYDALSMRRLATSLGVVPMAVYRHFDDKAALLDAVLERATSEIELPGPRVKPRTALAQIARRIRGAVLAHPALVPALVLRPSLGVSGLPLGERAHEALREAGITGERAGRDWSLLAMYALGFAIVEAPRVAPELVSGSMPSGLNEGELDPSLASELPLTIAAGLAPSEFFSVEQFEHGLSRILDAILER